MPRSLLKLIGGGTALLAALAVAASVASAGARPGPLRTPRATRATANPEIPLALAMLRGVGGVDNAIISPASLYTALAMVDQGASGQTAAQLDAVLGVAGAADAATGSRALTPRHEAGGPTLRAANGLWLQTGLHLTPSFSADLDAHFGAAPQQVDFSGDPSAAIQAINAWVSQHTAGLIPSLMGPGTVDAQTNLVLANALYLDARWQTPFDPDRTAPATFHTATASVSTPFMNSSDTASFPYTQGRGYRAVALPYAHSSLQFLAIMPTAGTLASFTRALTPTRLSTIIAGLRTRALQLALPKFSLSTQTSLNAFLQGQGVTRAFSGASQLDRMVRGRALAIQAVEQAAVLKVAEKGTVAAAATGVSVAPTAVEADPIMLSLDHPFLVLLRDSTSGSILFAARVADPSASAG